MKMLLSYFLFALVFLASPAFAGFEGISNVTSLKLFNKLQCSTGMTCTRVGDKFKLVASPSITGPLSITGALTGDGTGAISGFIAKRVAATATTLTAAQCGSTVVNSGAVVINLPNGSSGIIGCKFTFITGNASNFDVNPGNSDQILLLTNAAGDAIRNATVGNSVVLELLSATTWAPVGKEQGTYTDIN